MFEDIDLNELASDERFKALPEEDRRSTLQSYVAEVGQDSRWKELDKDTKFGAVRNIEKMFGLYKEEEPPKLSSVVTEFSFDKVKEHWGGVADKIRRSAVRAYDKTIEQGETIQREMDAVPDGSPAAMVPLGMAGNPILGKAWAAGAGVQRTKPVTMSPSGGLVDAETGEPVNTDANILANVPKVTVDDLPKLAREFRNGLNVGNFSLGMDSARIGRLQKQAEELQKNGGSKEDLVRAYQQIRDIQVETATNMQTIEENAKRHDQIARYANSIGQMTGDTREMVVGGAAMLVAPFIPGVGAAYKPILQGALGGAGMGAYAEYTRKNYVDNIFQGKVNNFKEYISRETDAMLEGAKAAPAMAVAGAAVHPSLRPMAALAVGGAVFTGIEGYSEDRVPTSGDFFRNVAVLATMKIPVHAAKGMAEAYTKSGMHPDTFTEGLMESYANLEKKATADVYVTTKDGKVVGKYRTQGARGEGRTQERTAAQDAADQKHPYYEGELEIVGGLDGSNVNEAGVPVFTLARSPLFHQQRGKMISALEETVRTDLEKVKNINTELTIAKGMDKYSLIGERSMAEKRIADAQARLRSMRGTEAVADELVTTLHENAADSVGLMSTLLSKSDANRLRDRNKAPSTGKKRTDISTGYGINLNFMGDWRTVFEMFSNRGFNKDEMRSIFSKMYLGIENSVTKDVLKDLKEAKFRHDNPEAFREMLKKTGLSETQIDIVRQSQDLRRIGSKLGFSEKELNEMMQDVETNSAVIDGLGQANKTEIHKRVKALGSLEGVDAAFWMEDNVSRYAKKYARSIFKENENAPRTLQVEPGDEITIVRDAEAGVRQYRPIDEALALIDGKTNEITEAGIKEVKKMYMDSMDTAPVERQKIAVALRRIKTAVDKRATTVNVYDEAGQKVGEKVIPTNKLATEQVAAKSEAISKPTITKEERVAAKARHSELGDALEQFDALRQSMTPQEWANFKLPTDTIPAPERIGMLQEEFVATGKLLEAQGKAKGKKGTTLSMMGSGEDFRKTVLPVTTAMRDFFRFVKAGTSNYEGQVGVPEFYLNLNKRLVEARGAYLLQPDGRWINTGFMTHNAAAKAFYGGQRSAMNQKLPMSEWYGDLCRENGVLRVRFGKDYDNPGASLAYVDTEGVFTKQQMDALTKLQKDGAINTTHWVLNDVGMNYKEGAGVFGLMKESQKMGWFTDAKDLGLIGKGGKGFTLSFMGTGAYEKVPGLFRKSEVHEEIPIAWTDVFKWIENATFETTRKVQVAGQERMNLARSQGRMEPGSEPIGWQTNTPSTSLGKGKWFTKWNDVETGSYFMDREGKVFGGDYAIHMEMIFDAIEGIALERGIDMSRVESVRNTNDLLMRALIDSGYMRINLAEGVTVQGYVKMSKQQLGQIEALKRARAKEYFEFEFGNETTGMSVQGDKYLWGPAVKSADIVAASEKQLNLVDRMYRWQVDDNGSIGFMGTQELNRGLDTLANWARKNDRPGLALAAQLKDQFKKLCFYPDAPPNLANAIRKEVIGGLNQVMLNRQKRVDRITMFDGKKASDKEIASATEIIYLKDQLTRTIEGRGNPEITLKEAEQLLVDANKNATPRIQSMVERMRQELDLNAQDLVRRGKLDPDSLITDYAPHLVEDYTPEWAPIFNIPKKLSRPFRGYTKEAKGSNREYRKDFGSIVDFLTMAEHHNLLEDFMLKWADNYDIGKTLSPDMKMALFGKDGWKSNQVKTDVPNEWHQKPGTIIEIDGKRYVVWSPDTPFAKELYPHYENRRVMNEETGSYERTEKGGFVKEEKFAGLMVGKAKRTYLLPEDVSTTFKHMVTPFGNSVGDYATAVANRLTMNFKEIAILANYPKFNFNNLIGDAFMLTMQHPAKMEFIASIPEAMKLVAKHYGIEKFGPMTPEEKVFWNWMQEQDVLGGTIKAEFRRNVAKDPNAFRKFLDKVELTSDYREAVLRTANAHWLYKEMQEGRGGQAVNKYRHINTEGIESVSDQLGKIARDSAIDYQRTSRDFSRYVKNLVFPFGKWYFDATRIVWKYAKEHPFQVMLALNSLPATAFVLNNRDSDTQRMEAQLPAKVREQLHVVLGKNADGSIKVWTLQTPQDALIGTKVFTMAWNQMNYVYNGQKDITTASRDLLVDWGVREAESVAFLMSPITRFMKGLYSGKDPWDGRPVYSTQDRDKMPSWEKRKDEGLFFMKTMVPMLGSAISNYNDKAQPAERVLLDKLSSFSGSKAIGISDYDPQAHLTVKNGKVINYDTLEKIGELEARDAMLIHKIKDDWVRSGMPMGAFFQSEDFKKRLEEFKSLHAGNNTPQAQSSFAKRIMDNTMNDPSTTAAYLDNLVWKAEKAGKSAEASKLRDMKGKLRTYQMFEQLRKTNKTVRDMIDDVYMNQNQVDYDFAQRMQKLDKFMEENKIEKAR